MSINDDFDSFWGSHHDNAGWGMCEKALARQAFRYAYELAKKEEAKRIAKLERAMKDGISDVENL